MQTIIITLNNGKKEEYVKGIKVKEILKKYDNCFFHTDATQSIGKLDTNFENVDLITFSPHKFYGINGIGVLIKKDNVKLEGNINLI